MNLVPGIYWFESSVLYKSVLFVVIKKERRHKQLKYLHECTTSKKNTIPSTIFLLPICNFQPLMSLQFLSADGVIFCNLDIHRLWVISNKLNQIYIKKKKVLSSFGPCQMTDETIDPPPPSTFHRVIFMVEGLLFLI